METGFGFLNGTPEWERHWRGMPAFCQKDLTPYQTVNVSFRSPEDREAFARLIGRQLTSRSRSIWYPREDIGRMADKRFKSERPVHPVHPIYVISKGRWESRLTVKALERMGVDYKVVVEPQEQKRYARVIDPEKILTLPFSNLGQGSIPARNWVWEHSIERGARWHWILDDNIDGFYRLYDNIKTPVACGNVFAAAEAFVDRYENVGQAGFNYFMFVSRKDALPPYYLNTRIYSCILIRNDLPHRWRGRYNEDTDLSLRILKDGWCTVLFNAFLAMKMPTMTMRGGNTDQLYQGDGRYQMAKSLKDQHPDVVTVTRKWGRWQHHVDYRRFKRNKLKLKASLGSKDYAGSVDNFGMYLERDVDRPLLLVGQAPGSGGDPDRPLEGKIGRRLARLTGLTEGEYLERTERFNLIQGHPGKDGKGDLWDRRAAALAAEEAKDRLRGRRALLLGRQVAVAFGLPAEDLPWMEWRSDRRLKAEVAVIPHPSGIVQWWNDSENRRAAARFLRSTFKRREEPRA